MVFFTIFSIEISAQAPVRIPFPIPVFDRSEPYDDDYHTLKYGGGHYKRGNKEGYTKYSSNNKYGGYDTMDYNKYTRKAMNKVHKDQHEGYHKQAKEMQNSYGQNSGYGSKRRRRGSRRNYKSNY